MFTVVSFFLALKWSFNGEVLIHNNDIFYYSNVYLHYYYTLYYNGDLFYWKVSHVTYIKITLLKIARMLITMSQDMRFPKMRYVRPAKGQTRLRIRAVWSEPLLVA